MNTTDFVAWWGAGVATVVLIWDMLKWSRQGPKLRVTLTPNVSYPDSRVISEASTASGDISRELADYVHIDISNVGDRPTTLLDIQATHQDVLGKGVLYNGQTRFRFHHGQSLPIKLGAGENISARFEMKDLEGLSSRGSPLLLLQASHLPKRLTIKLPEFKV